MIGFALHGVPSFGLRFFNVYGKRQDPNSPYSGVISIFARLALAGETLNINGDGQQTRDFVHVSDVVAHLWAAMRLLHDTPQQGVLNVCTGHSITVRQLAEQILCTLGVNADRIAHGTPRPGDIRQSFGSAELASAVLGLRSQTALADGLRDLLGDGSRAQPTSLRTASPA